LKSRSNCIALPVLLPAELLDSGQSFGRRATAPVNGVALPLVQFATYHYLSDARHPTSLPLGSP
jgi:hypothetical protein